jgi:hypothetical protein
MRVTVAVMTAVPATGLASPGAWPEGLVNQRLDRSRTAPAFGAATEAPVKLLGIPRQLVGHGDRFANIVIGNNVAGTHNHGTGPVSEIFAHRLGSPFMDSKPSAPPQKENTYFEAIPNCRSMNLSCRY